MSTAQALPPTGRSTGRQLPGPGIDSGGTTMTIRTEDTTVQVTRKSGKGLRDGVVSELFTVWDVKPGHEEALRAACERLATTLKSAPVELNVQTGLRDERHVIFDDGTRMVWCTTFEADWDPYVEDAIMRIGIDNFTDWLQHTTAADEWQAWIHEAGGIDHLRGVQGGLATDRASETSTRMSLAGLKKFLQDHQVPAAGYYNAMSYITHAETRKALAVNEAFQQVLDTPGAAESLQDPTLAPLLDLAAD
jgi:hypothetical protein